MPQRPKPPEGDLQPQKTLQDLVEMIGTQEVPASILNRPAQGRRVKLSPELPEEVLRTSLLMVYGDVRLIPPRQLNELGLAIEVAYAPTEEQKNLAPDERTRRAYARAPKGEGISGIPHVALVENGLRRTYSTSRHQIIERDIGGKRTSKTIKSKDWSLRGIPEEETFRTTEDFVEAYGTAEETPTSYLEEHGINVTLRKSQPPAPAKPKLGRSVGRASRQSAPPKEAEPARAAPPKAQEVAPLTRVQEFAGALGVTPDVAAAFAPLEKVDKPAFESALETCRRNAGLVREYLGNRPVEGKERAVGDAILCGIPTHGQARDAVVAGVISREDISPYINVSDAAAVANELQRIYESRLLKSPNRTAGPLIAMLRPRIQAAIGHGLDELSLNPGLIAVHCDDTLQAVKDSLVAFGEQDYAHSHDANTQLRRLDRIADLSNPTATLLKSLVEEVTRPVEPPAAPEIEEIPPAPTEEPPPPPRPPTPPPARPPVEVGGKPARPEKVTITIRADEGPIALNRGSEKAWEDFLVGKGWPLGGADILTVIRAVIKGGMGREGLYGELIAAADEQGTTVELQRVDAGVRPSAPATRTPSGVLPTVKDLETAPAPTEGEAESWAELMADAETERMIGNPLLLLGSHHVPLVAVGPLVRKLGDDYGPEVLRQGAILAAEAFELRKYTSSNDASRRNRGIKMLEEETERRLAAWEQKTEITSDDFPRLARESVLVSAIPEGSKYYSRYIEQDSRIPDEPHDQYDAIVKKYRKIQEAIGKVTIGR